MRLACAIVFLSVFSGCAVQRFATIASSNGKEPLLTNHWSEAASSCVLVMLPGIGDSPERFVDFGFIDVARQGRHRCDVVTVDAHFGYYRDANIVTRLSDVLQPLRERYEAVWLVGVSMGGYGAALTARQRPELVDGIVLIAPFLGLTGAVRPIIERVEAQGLEAFVASRTSTNPRKHFVEVEPLWEWLAQRARAHGDDVVLGWGTRDRFAPTLQVVGESFEENAFIVDGAHDWKTFAAVFREVAAMPPWAQPTPDSLL